MYTDIQSIQLSLGAEKAPKSTSDHILTREVLREFVFGGPWAPIWSPMGSPRRYWERNWHQKSFQKDIQATGAA